MSVIINTNDRLNSNKKYICNLCRADLNKVSKDPNDYSYICMHCGATYNPKVEDVRKKDKVARVESALGGVTKAESNNIEQVIFIDSSKGPEKIMTGNLMEDDRIPQNIKNYAKVMGLGTKLIKYRDDKINVSD